MVAGAEVIQHDPAASWRGRFSAPCTVAESLINNDSVSSISINDAGTFASRASVSTTFAGSPCKRLLARAIDGDRQHDAPIQPLAQLSTNRAHHPTAHVQDEAAVFGDLDETIRRDVAVLGIAPAKQCLDADQLTILDPELGLEHQTEQIVVNRLAQVDLPARASHASWRSLQARTKQQRRTIAPGVIHRRVRMLEHCSYIARRRPDKPRRPMFGEE